MKINQWMLVLAAGGVLSLNSVIQAEEAQHQVLTALSSTTLSGYVDTSAIWKFGTGNNLVGRTYDGANKQDGFNLNAVVLALAKPLDDSGWSAGYNVDLIFGPDANQFGSTSTLMSGAFGSDFAIKQANVKLRAAVAGKGLDFTLGVFETPFGYEYFDATKDANYSRSYGYTIVPRQHTGVVAFYPFTDWMAVAAGVANTANAAINERPTRLTAANGIVPASESEKTYVAGLYLTAPESFGCLKGATLNFVLGNGLDGVNAATPSHATCYYIGSTIPTPLAGLSIGVAYDYFGLQENAGFPGYPAVYANATAVYLNYKATDKLQLNNRLEYASGSSGVWAGKPPGGEEFFGETFTVDYSLWTNVISRVEFRWDHDLTARRGAPAPFGGGPTDGDKNAISLALNVIYKF